MAYMIPETLNSLEATAGETALFKLLQNKLSDDVYVWFNIPIKQRFADFVILDPKLGLLILEVKDWQLSQIKEINPKYIVIETSKGQKSCTNPLNQARNYALQIVDLLASDPLLVQSSNDYKGKLAFPFSYGVVWSRIKSEDFKSSLPELFEVNKALFYDHLSTSINAEKFQQQLQMLFPQYFNFHLSTEQIDRIRYHLFPEIRLPRKQFPVKQIESKDNKDFLPELETDSKTILTVMDLEQERLAKHLGEGHRLLRGVAGSGKTWTLICRARILAQLYPDWKILVLCYNVSLTTMLKQMIDMVALPKCSANIKVTNYHPFLAQLAARAKVEQASGEKWAEILSQNLNKLIDEGKYKVPSFDAILIDEAHDFHPEWLKLIVRCLNPKTNSLFIVHDSAQNIYRKGFSFKSVGIQIKGRAKILKTNYRNTREIAQLASSFLNCGVKFTDELLKDDEGQLLEIIRPQATLRSGLFPQLIECQSFREECAEIAARVKLWLEKGKYPPQEILILYVKKGANPNDEKYIQAILTSLEEAGIEYEWITRNQESKRSFQLSSAKVKVSTIHSAKGLDFAAVALVGLSLLPSSIEQAEVERKLVYVGLTRARNELLITHCKASQFIVDLKQCREKLALY
ncbi:MAG: NERD domain-containing protein [Acidobacteria bacterium]|nr:NERD domain-containing protein [Acidobacteriota bacterium]